MVSWAQPERRTLGWCHGYRVFAGDALVGEIETPLFSPGGDTADYLILRASGNPRRLVPVGLVVAIDKNERSIHLRVSAADIQRLPVSLPVGGVHRRFR